MSAPVEVDRPGRRDHARQGQAERRLARAGFADDAERLPGADRDVDAVDRLHMVDDLRKKPCLIGNQTLMSLPDMTVGAVRSAAGGLPFGSAAEQMAGVFVLRIGEDLRRRSRLDDLAVRHDADAVGDLAHDAEVMGDEEHRHALAGLQIGEQLQDLRLDGDVERGRRLVGDQQVRLVGERHGDHHALPLAARQLMRIGAEAALRIADADFRQQLQRPLPALPVAHALVQASESRRSAARSCAAD